jgi:hypothetical protein
MKILFRLTVIFWFITYFLFLIGSAILWFFKGKGGFDIDKFKWFERWTNKLGL